MLVTRVSTWYAINSGDTPRPGTIGLRFNATGAAVFATARNSLGAQGAVYDSVSITAVAGETIETGPLYSVTTLPAGTYAMVGR